MNEEKCIYVLKDDEKRIDDIRKLGANLSRTPEPFFGNIENPSVLVLSSFPRDNELMMLEEKENPNYRKALHGNLELRYFNYLDRVIKNENYLNKWPKENSKIWNSLFERTRIFINSLDFKYPHFESLIGVIHYFPYRINEKYNGDLINNLDSQNKIFQHAADLIEKENPLVVVIGDEKLWLDKVPTLDRCEKITVVNAEDIPTFQIIKICNRLMTDYKNKDILIKKYKSEFKLFKILKSFESDIEKIKLTNNTIIVENIDHLDSLNDKFEEKVELDITGYNEQNIHILKEIYGGQNLYQNIDKMDINDVYQVTIYLIKNHQLNNENDYVYLYDCYKRLKGFFDGPNKKGE